MEMLMSSTKILIVDDELVMRESLAGWLERDGHETDTAASGQEALTKLKASKYDILLVDIQMELLKKATGRQFEKFWGKRVRIDYIKSREFPCTVSYYCQRLFINGFYQYVW